MSTDTDTDGRRVQHRRAQAVMDRFHKLDRFGIARRIGWNTAAADGRRPMGGSEKIGWAWKIIAAGSRPGHARGLLKAWPGWEYISELLWPTIAAPGAPHGVLRIRIERHRRAPVMLSGGIQITRGNLVGELHCDSRSLLRLVRTRRNPFAACRDDLRGLARWLETDELGRRVIALHGVTILIRGALRLGFVVEERPVTIRRRLEKVFFTGLLLLYSEAGLKRLGYGATPHTYPQDVWISRRELMRLYSAHGGGKVIRDERFINRAQPPRGAHQALFPG